MLQASRGKLTKRQEKDEDMVMTWGCLNQKTKSQTRGHRKISLTLCRCYFCIAIQGICYISLILTIGQQISLLFTSFFGRLQPSSLFVFVVFWRHLPFFSAKMINNKATTFPCAHNLSITLTKVYFHGLLRPTRNQVSKCVRQSIQPLDQTFPSYWLSYF